MPRAARRSGSRSRRCSAGGPVGPEPCARGLQAMILLFRAHGRNFSHRRVDSRCQCSTRSGREKVKWAGRDSGRVGSVRHQAAGRSPPRSRSACCRRLDLPKGRKEAIVTMRVSLIAFDTVSKARCMLQKGQINRALTAALAGCMHRHLPGIFLWHGKNNMVYSHSA